jgi:hypothetical protein
MVRVDLDVVGGGTLNGTIVVAATAARYVSGTEHCLALVTDAWEKGVAMPVTDRSTAPSYGITGLTIHVTSTTPTPPPSPKPTASFVGVGMTPEAIENNPVVYELASETRWGVPGTYGLAALTTLASPLPSSSSLASARSAAGGGGEVKFDVQRWTKVWANSRYPQQQQEEEEEGADHSASSSFADGWSLLVSDQGPGVYANQFDNSNCGAAVSFPLGRTGCCASCNNALTALSADPNKPLAPVNPGGGDDPVEGHGGYTNATHHLLAWTAFHKAVKQTSTLPKDKNALGSSALAPTVVYDYIDVSRQALDHIFWDVTRILDAAIHRGDANTTRTVGQEQLELIATMDAVLSAGPEWLLGAWVQRARDRGRTPEDTALFEYNARNQVTLWGPTGANLNDYARKEWAGTLGTYYARRWQIATDAAVAALESSHSAVDMKKLHSVVLQFELGWQTNASLVFPAEPTGDVAALVDAAYLHVADDSLLAGYEARAGVDVTATDTDLTSQPAWHKNPAVLAYLCSLDAACRGFTSSGRFKRNVNATTTSPASTLYIKL